MGKETDKPADALLEAIKQWHKRMHGVVLSGKELMAEAGKVIKERISK